MEIVEYKNKQGESKSFVLFGENTKDVKEILKGEFRAKFSPYLDDTQVPGRMGWMLSKKTLDKKGYNIEDTKDLMYQLKTLFESAVKPEAKSEAKILIMSIDDVLKTFGPKTAKKIIALNMVK